jgi:CDP-glucose 4,6-dehydratase
MAAMGMTGKVDPAFWRGRRVLLTGHTGFKGAWCAMWLARMGAEVTGFSLAPEGTPNVFEGAGVASDVSSVIGDLRDRDAVRRVVEDCAPEIVLHFAAQALVRRAVQEPIETISANVLGTAHLLDALRDVRPLRAVLVVTSDKVYENTDAGNLFTESDALGGSDPYSASKAAADLIAHAMARTYFAKSGVAVATARGGNVIGGGDYAHDRLIPDIVRAVSHNAPVLLRYPDAVRPWQHVLDCLSGYLVYVQALCERRDVPLVLNIGPAATAERMTVRRIAEAILDGLGSRAGWRHDERPAAREAGTLALDSSRIRTLLGWRDRLPMPLGLRATTDWYRAVSSGESMRAVTLRQIDQYGADADAVIASNNTGAIQRGAALP